MKAYSAPPAYNSPEIKLKEQISTDTVSYADLRGQAGPNTFIDLLTLLIQLSHFKISLRDVVSATTVLFSLTSKCCHTIQKFEGTALFK